MTKVIQKIEIDNENIKGRIEVGKFYNLSDFFYGDVKGKVNFIYKDYIIEEDGEIEIKKGVINFDFICFLKDEIVIRNYLVDELDTLESIEISDKTDNYKKIN